MSLWKRALLSILRRKPKSLILLLIVFVLGNVMLSTLAIVQSVDSTREIMLRKLPPTVTLEFDQEAVLDNLEKGDAEPDNDIERTQLTVSDLKRIEEASGEYIQSYNYYVPNLIYTDSLETVREVKRVGGREEESFSLLGVNNTDLTLLETGEAKITEGRSFTEEEIDQGSPVIIMSEELAQINDLVVGDLIRVEEILFDRQDSDKIIDTFEHEFKLIGVLSYEEQTLDDRSAGMREREQHETIYVPYSYNVKTSIKQYEEIEIPHYKENYGEDFVEETFGDIDVKEISNRVPGTIVYYLNSSEDINDFVNSASAVLELDHYTFVTQEDNFNQIAGPLQTMQDILNHSFYFVIGAAVLLLTLVLLGFLKERQTEIGIYLALGEKKKKITAQMLAEAVGITLIGATLALITGLFVSSNISDMLLAAPGMELEEATRGMYEYSARYDFDSVMDKYRVALSFKSIVSYYAVITATTVAAQLISSIYIMKFDPRKIMKEG